MSELTEWFPGLLTPARPGVYQRQYSDKVVYCLWDGGGWRAWAETPESAAYETDRSIFEHQPWRGLAQEPKQ